MTGILTLGPFAIIFGVYSTLVQYLPENWFTQGWVRYASAAAAATAAGLMLYLLGQRVLMRDSVEPRAPAPSPSVPRPRTEVLSLPVEDAQVDVPTVERILDGTRRELVSDFTIVRGDPVKAGWSQFFGGARPPGAVGTAFGIRLALALDIIDAKIDRALVLASLVAAQRIGGGWSGRTQRPDTARSEVTAWVLDGAAPIGLDSATRVKLVRLLEGLMDPAVDKEGNERVAVMASVATTLSVLDPSSEALPPLASRLLDAATMTTDSDRLAYWSERTQRGMRPSVPHTARSIVALRAITHVLPRFDRATHLAETVDAGLAWIEGHFDLRPVDERLRRVWGTDADAEELMVIQHFTASWVAQALLASDNLTDRRLDLLRRAVRDVVAAQKNGVWRWRETDQEPVWMSYQGASVLRDYALRNLGWPP